MSTILAVDASSEACSVALLSDGQVHGAFILAPRQHTQRLLPMIDELLAAHQVALSDLDAIAYGRGPGSFTGLRICLGLVQGLAFSCDIPVIPVSTLQTLAVGAIRQFNLPLHSKILVALDARMNEIYGAVFESSSGLPVATVDEFVGPATDLKDCPALIEVTSDQLTKVGGGCHYEFLQSLMAKNEDQQLLPRAEDMLVIAQQAYQNKQYIKAEEAQPVYLRDSVAWKKRQRIRQ
ncbi:MAG: tRNA (adenosine(37)-N6)-threonylcarbamoyltransferase complex dimerization subunit type 1 TsaB [Cellvibrionaceae bacterium]